MLNHQDRIAIRRVIVDRCTAAVVKYANYILGNQSATTPQLAWAREAMRTPGAVGDQLSWYVIDQPAYVGQVDGSTWSGGSSIDDTTLQGVIEAAINTHFIAEA